MCIFMVHDCRDSRAHERVSAEERDLFVTGFQDLNNMLAYPGLSQIQEGFQGLPSTVSRCLCGGAAIHQELFNLPSSILERCFVSTALTMKLSAHHQIVLSHQLR